LDEGLSSGLAPQHSEERVGGLVQAKEAAPSHAREVRSLFVDRLTPEQLDQLADFATTIVGHLQADQPPS
jgi:hypothetical protein